MVSLPCPPSPLKSSKCGSISPTPGWSWAESGPPDLCARYDVPFPPRPTSGHCSGELSHHQGTPGLRPQKAAPSLRLPSWCCYLVLDTAKQAFIFVVESNIMGFGYSNGEESLCKVAPNPKAGGDIYMASCHGIPMFIPKALLIPD